MLRRQGGLYRIIGVAVATVVVFAACGDGASTDSSTSTTQTESTTETSTPATTSADSSDEIEELDLVVTTVIGGPEQLNNQAVAAWLDAVEEASDGQITYEFHYANTLAAPADIGAELDSGTVDVALWVPAYQPAAHPITNWLMQLAGLGDAGLPSLVMQRATTAMHWWYGNAEAAQEDYIANGIRPIAPGMQATMVQDLICNTPIETLEDAQGKQARTGAETIAQAVQNIGMEPVTLPGAEMYEALQRGVVDCVVLGPHDIVNLDMWSVGKHFTGVNFSGFTAFGLYASEQAWGEMSDAQQRVMLNELPVYLEETMNGAIREFYRFFDEAEEMDVEIHQPSEDLISAVAEHRDSVVEGAASQAPDSVSDPQAAVDSYRELSDLWGQILVDELGYPSYDSWNEWAAAESPADFDPSAWSQRAFEEFIAPQVP